MHFKTITYKKILILVLLCLSFSVIAESQDYNTNSDQVTVSDSYQIGPGDVLHISVWKEEDMQLDVLVTPDGGITFPLAGEIKASGLTTKAITEVLVGKLKRYIPHPIVTVSVLKSVSNKVYVIGKVNRPGEFTATGYLDVLQALTMAGGAKEGHHHQH